ncbi:MAG TPA: FxSxx-COOH system tetratricopeptide repeat protein, partial [Rugosimonospora sp.]|nr:FxSxx-COOH system tetratricopeptide repeat protein [Rugosimonospora sp.]
NPAFTGRDDALERLRELLANNAASTVPVALYGLGGIGKTQIAIEYAHRFAADYDVIWWISADQPPLVRTALADLAEAVGLPGGEGATAQVAAVLDALRQGTPSPRWLVVFDNAGDPEQLREYLPVGPGDVLITSLSQAWAREAVPVEVGVFDRADSVELLSRRVDQLARGDAEEIAEKVGDLPLAVEQAAAWLATTAMAPRKYIELLDEHLPRMLNEPPPPGYPYPAAATWRLSLDKLREVNPAAVGLLELFAFFAPEPIPSQLLSNARMIDLLVEYDPSLRDTMLHARLLRDIGKFALARVDMSVKGIRVHQLVQNVIRDGLSPEVRAKNREHVQEIVATERRGDPSDQRTWETYEGLRRHIDKTGLLESDKPEAREFILDMARYLRHRGDYAGGLDLAGRALEVRRRLAEPDIDTLRLRLEQANLLRVQGDYSDSYAIDQDVLERLDHQLGDDHEYTLLAASGLGADLRGLGEYRRSREMEERTLARWRASVGEDYSRTYNTANNLAVSLRLVGDFHAALRLDQETMSRRTGTLGLLSHFTLASAGNLGRDLREVGNLRASLERLAETLELCRRELGIDHERTLVAAKELAITQRRLGDYDAARRLIRDTVERCERHLGSGHPLTVACVLEHGCVLSRRGEHAEAQVAGETVLASYRRSGGDDHAFTITAENDLAVFRIRAGDYERAATLIEDAAERFPSVLGEVHAHTLICLMNLATYKAGTGSRGDALRLDEHCHQQLLAQFNVEHPTVLAAAANLAVSRTENGAGQDGRDQLEEARRIAHRVLGQDHPDTLAIEAGRRITMEIEPPPT